MRKNKKKKQLSKTRRRVKRIALCVLAALLIMIAAFVLAACLPYTGYIPVSDETKDSFSVSNFLGDGACPERVMLLSDEQEAFTHRLILIENAREEIFFCSYLVQKNDTAKVFFSYLFAASERGVKVHILLDEKSKNATSVAGLFPEIRYALVGDENIDFYEFNPLNLLAPQNINPTMHDKFIIADNDYMILGGRNIGDQYYDHDAFDRNKNFIDNEILVYNTSHEYSGSVTAAAGYFQELISHPLTKKRESASKAQLARGAEERLSLLSLYETHKLTLPAGADYETLTTETNKVTLLTNPTNKKKNEPVIAYNLYMLAMNSDRVVASTPYVTLRDKNLDRLADISAAADKFVILTNSVASATNIQSMNYYYNRKKILKTGVELYEYQDDYNSIHLKGMLFGDRLTASGSFNIAEHSIYMNTESMLIIDSPGFNALYAGYLGGYLSNSLKVGSDNKYEPSETVEPAEVSGWTEFGFLCVGFVLNLVKFLL